MGGDSENPGDRFTETLRGLKKNRKTHFLDNIAKNWLELINKVEEIRGEIDRLFSKGDEELAGLKKGLMSISMPEMGEINSVDSFKKALFAIRYRAGEIIGKDKKSFTEIKDVFAKLRIFLEPRGADSTDKKEGSNENE